MELSAVVKEYAIPLTRAEQDLVARLDAGASSRPAALSDKRMQAIADGRAAVQKLPDKRTTERQMRMDKAAMLKERLKMLRQMIPFLSAAALKSLKVEMRQIASQVASLEAGSGGGAAPGPTAAAPPSDSGAATTTDVPQSDTAPPAGEDAKEGQRTPSGAALPGLGVYSGDTGAEDRQMKESVAEVRNLYRSVQATLKRRQQAERSNRQPPRHALRLRVYAGMPDSRGTVAVDA